MIPVLTNPGSGAVPQATLREAWKNIRAFRRDVDPTIRIKRVPKFDYGDGRYAFVLSYRKQKVEIQMPGLPLNRVRFVSAPGQNPFDFPRLFVSGSSWLWEIAIDCAKSDLGITR